MTGFSRFLASSTCPNLQSYSTKALCLGVKQKMFMTQKKTTISPVPFEISISNSAALLQHVLNL